MRRRDFISLIGGAAIAWPQSLIAQGRKKLQLIGILANEAWPPLDGLRNELRELGYIGGQNFNIIYRFAEGQADRYPALAAELESRSRKSAQGDRWSFCLMAGTLCPANQERP